MDKFKNMSTQELEKVLAERRAAEEKSKIKRIESFEKDRDSFVNDLVNLFQTTRATLQELKDNAITTGNDLYIEKYAMHGKEPKECKQFSLIHSDGNSKVVLERHETMTFNDQAEVAINSIKEFFRDKFESRSKVAYSILNTLLEKNRQGDYDPKMLAKLRKEVNQINDPKLTESFELLVNSQTVSGSCLYLRVYTKDKHGKWKDIVIQFSAL